MAAQKQLTDCPSNLKEAIDWILRVTGKDGGGGDNGGAITKLSEEVKKLLDEVKGADAGLGAEIDKVKNALGNGSSGLMKSLADGLQQFIGYKEGGNGIIEANKGIAVSNLPIERLRDAVVCVQI
ncbi:variant erythrocyte surface antigen-1 family protein [Babesia caballi]|uniref:Variant erythrocyte surface antigen-1 family protein n=1 Tax=Babesia caballi TaxID=5871 RepID=A0AAV4LZ29_BABCB|nr:variant erythrocyte surface antigen-1 family protein [Babesia caballi]